MNLRKLVLTNLQFFTGPRGLVFSAVDKSLIEPSVSGPAASGLFACPAARRPPHRSRLSPPSTLAVPNSFHGDSPVVLPFASWPSSSEAGDIFVFWSFFKTFFRKRPLPKRFLKIDRF